MRFDINYMNEILPGEVTGIWTARVEDTGGAFYAGAFEGRKENGLANGLTNGLVAFRAELRLR